MKNRSNLLIAVFFITACVQKNDVDNEDDDDIDRAMEALRQHALRHLQPFWGCHALRHLQGLRQHAWRKSEEERF